MCHSVKNYFSKSKSHSLNEAHDQKNFSRLAKISSPRQLFSLSLLGQNAAWTNLLPVKKRPRENQYSSSSRKKTKRRPIIVPAIALWLLKMLCSKFAFSFRTLNLCLPKPSRESFGNCTRKALKIDFHSFFLQLKIVTFIYLRDKKSYYSSYCCAKLIIKLKSASPFLIQTRAKIWPIIITWSVIVARTKNPSKTNTDHYLAKMKKKILQRLLKFCQVLT